MGFDIIGTISTPQTIAVGTSIRDHARLQRVYGRGRRRKRKGSATIRLEDGSVRLAELHWYEAAGIGRRDLKIKRYLDR